MQKKLDNYLVQKYPKIFVNRYGDPRETALCWGFEHGDGWFWLIDQLCDSIQGYIDSNNKYRSDNEKIPQIIATQVKEKYGTLCFYFDGGDDVIDGMVRIAENMSANICEFCGSTENIGYTQGWISTICKNCHENSGDTISNRIWKERKDNFPEDVTKYLRKIKLDKLEKKREA
jgi:hypothetical protein